MINCNFFKTLLTHLRKSQPCDPIGFTLVELLVSIIIGGLIVTSVLGIMNDVIRASKEEEVRTETQNDMERALEFIEDELQSATYIYTGEQIRNARSKSPSIGPLTDYLNLNSDYVVVLAFWKPERIPYTASGGQIPLDCDNGSGGLNPNINSSIVLDPNATDQERIDRCEELQVERRTYTLVVYVQDTSPTNTWSGETVIRRFEMRKFEDTATLERTSGNKGVYIDPIKEADDFRRWPFDIDGNNLQAGLAKPNITGQYIMGQSDLTPVLVDFADDPQSNPGNLPTCLDEDTDGDNRLDTGEDDPANGGNGNGILDVYSRTPSVAQSTSFFACVRESILIGDISEQNQDVILYLRGNPKGRSGVQINPNSYTPLPMVRTQVLLRGVVDKFFND